MPTVGSLHGPRARPPRGRGRELRRAHLGPRRHFLDVLWILWRRRSFRQRAGRAFMRPRASRGLGEPFDRHRKFAHPSKPFDRRSSAARAAAARVGSPAHERSPPRVRSAPRPAPREAPRGPSPLVALPPTRGRSAPRHPHRVARPVVSHAHRVRLAQGPPRRLRPSSPRVACALPIDRAPDARPPPQRRRHRDARRHSRGLGRLRSQAHGCARRPRGPRGAARRAPPYARAGRGHPRRAATARS